MSGFLKALNDAAGTTGLGEAAAANALAGTSGLEVLGALNAYNTPPGQEYVAAVPGGKVGYTYDAASTGYLANASAQPFTLTRDVVCESVEVNMRSGTSMTLGAKVYIATALPTAGAIVCEWTAPSTMFGGAWGTVTWDTPVTLTQGTQYYLCTTELDGIGTVTTAQETLFGVIATSGNVRYGAINVYASSVAYRSVFRINEQAQAEIPAVAGERYREGMALALSRAGIIGGP